MRSKGVTDRVPLAIIAAECSIGDSTDYEGEEAQARGLSIRYCTVREREDGGLGLAGDNERVVYRVRFTMAGALTCYSGMLLVLAISAFGSRARLELWQSILEVSAGAVLIIPAFRLALASVRVRTGGITVVNPFRTYHIAWDQIDRFEIGAYKSAIFEFCLNHLADGKVIPACGLGTVPNQPRRRASVEARQGCDALNERLAMERPGVALSPPAEAPPRTALQRI